MSMRDEFETKKHRRSWRASCKNVAHEIFAFKEGFVLRLEEIFGTWCLIVYEHPIRVNVVALLIFALSMFGFIPPHARWIEGAENLYCLPVSQAMEDRMVHDSLFFEQASRAQFAIITSNPPGRNIFTWEDLDKVLLVDEMIRGQMADPVGNRLIALPAIKKFVPEGGMDESAYAALPDTMGKPVINFQDICSPDPVTGCRVQSVLEMGVFDIKKILPPDAPPELYVMDGLVFALNKKGFVPGLLLGGMTVVDCVRELPTALLSAILTEDRLFNGTTPGYSKSRMQCVTEATAFNFIYEIVDRRAFNQRNMAWEALYYKVMKDNIHFGNLTIGANAYRARDDELSKSTSQSADIIYVVFTFIMLIIYAALINFNCDLYRNKAMSSLMGSVAVFMGVISGLGFPSLFGVAFVPTALVTPFLVMGVGADDIFVIISSYALAYGEGSARERVAVALKGCGVSVLMTTVTNCLAFAIGVQSHYLAVKNFCIFTLCGLFLSLIYELTIFLTMVCYDARREESMMAFFVGLPKREKKPWGKVEETVSVFQLANVIVKQEYDQISSFNLKPYQRVKASREEKRNVLSMTRFRIKGMIRAFGNSGDMWWAPIGALQPETPPEIAVLSTDVSVTDDKKSPSGSISPESFMSPPSESRALTIPPSPARNRKGNLNVTDHSERCLLSPGHIERAKQPDGKGVKNAKGKPQTHVVSRFILDDKLRHAAYAREPRGNVGRRWRLGFIRYYCRLLLHPVSKALVILTFATTFSFAIYGIMNITKGLELVDLAPDGSYLKTYDHLQASYMNEYDLPIDVFYPEEVKWWELRVQNSLREYDREIRSLSTTKYLSDPLLRIIDDPLLTPIFTTGTKATFLKALRDTLSDPSSNYHQFDSEFVWDGDDLLTWRSLLLPVYMKSSEDRANWMRQVRGIGAQAGAVSLTNSTAPIDVVAWNFMLIFYESDLAIIPSVVASLATAAMAMIVIAFILIPEIYSGCLVIAIMGVIDFTVMGFMYYWDVALNMISMIILVISIGFSVDYTSHMCYIFTNSLGSSRNLRITETIVLVGTPLFHGAMANLAGVVLLGWSTSYIFRTFFKMMTLVVTFGISHGMILLPVLLSLFGTMAGCERVHEDEVCRLRDLFAGAPQIKENSTSFIKSGARIVSRLLSKLPAESAGEKELLPHEKLPDFKFGRSQDGHHVPSFDEHNDADHFSDDGSVPLPIRVYQQRST